MQCSLSFCIAPHPFLFQNIWEWSSEECVSASPACRSAERLAWRSEGGKTQTVANSVVADWQKVFMCICGVGSAPHVSWGYQSGISHCHLRSFVMRDGGVGLWEVSGCLSGCRCGSQHFRDHRHRTHKNTTDSWSSLIVIINLAQNTSSTVKCLLGHLR